MWMMLAVSLCGCPDGATAPADAQVCPYDVDSLYRVQSSDSDDSTSQVALWDWRNADCSREQLQVMCENGQLVVICEPCDGTCGSTTQTWTPNDDGSTSFEQVDNAGNSTTQRVWVRQ